MCDLFGQNYDLYYDNLKKLIFDRLDQDKDQLETIEQYDALDILENES